MLQGLIVTKTEKNHQQYLEALFVLKKRKLGINYC